ncbi:type II secretion system protein N [Aquabacterium sp. J223]|uniref:type II secretion system protein N n=1 Tax=Aquabacterium sp. J223 TaxID=2898431 RepID=UPI0021ADFCED|nr:type II secretion system protein N [Aquabacterium sp. J223]UUX96516.1 type II secretion system protein N [Aquabacterium sp. J223]
MKAGWLVSRLPVRRRTVAPQRAGARSAFAESTLMELAWQKTRKAAFHAGRWGLIVGLLVGLLAFAPASWLAAAVNRATEGRLLLTEVRGSVWSGSALLVLTGGADSRDATALPDRLHWRLGTEGLALALRLTQACCLNGEPQLLLRPGFGRLQWTLVPPPASREAGWVVQVPASLLSGLGTPWNTLQLNGLVRLSSPGLVVETVEGRWRVDGRADLLLIDVGSRVSTLERLGSYRLTVQGENEGGAAVSLTTLEGALQLQGDGRITAGRLRFRGDARAAPGQEAALNNLLNIIGRRQGALSLISIG